MVSDLKTNESSSLRSYGDFMDIFLLFDLSKAVLTRTLMRRKIKRCVTALCVWILVVV